ncbi:HAD-IIB family hydrolase [Enterococcus sp. LJL99]
MYQLVISDMDGTLTFNKEQNNEYDPANSKLPEKNRVALIKFLKMNRTFAVSTGRLLPDILAATDPVIHEKMFKITQNGSFIFNRENQLIHKNVYTKELLFIILNQLEQEKIPYAYSTYNTHFYKKELDITLIDKVFGKITPKIERQTTNSISEEVANVCVVSKNKEETKKKFEILTKLLDPQVVNFQITGPYSIDINPKGVSKGESAEYLANLLTIKYNDVAVVGDSFNDLSMFQNFEHSYCMSHSEESLQKQAKYVIDMFYEVLI